MKKSVIGYEHPHRKGGPETGLFPRKKDGEGSCPGTFPSLGRQARQIADYAIATGLSLGEAERVYAFFSGNVPEGMRPEVARYLAGNECRDPALTQLIQSALRKEPAIALMDLFTRIGVTR